jgi:hypothetical protein
VAICLCATALFADDPALISGRIMVFGSKIEVSPSVIETPAGIPVFLNTTGKGLAGRLLGELRGPSLSTAITVETQPGSPFQLPPLDVQGIHYLEDIRLVDSSNHILVNATPKRVEIHVIEILIKQVTSRPLSLEEIRNLGIVINEANYSATSFEVGLEFNSRQITVSFPVLLPKVPDLSPLIPPTLGSVSFAGIPTSQGTSALDSVLPYIVPIEFKPDPSFEFDGEALPDIPGILVFPFLW